MAGNGARTEFSAQKRLAIQEAGTRVFLRMGYEASSMDLIASEAGVAKQTLYNHFHNKETLFKAIIEDLASEFLSPLQAGGAGDAGPEQVLESFGRQALAMMLRPSSLALHRVLVAEASRFPQMAQAVYRAGPAEAVRRLAGYLQEETERGRLAVAEPVLAAEQFLGMLTGHIQLRALFGVCAPPAPAEINKCVRYAVRNFLEAHATHSGGDTRER